ncbi:a-factor receptor [Ceratobasidium sp. 394]|nr:a-factor receptor [Ceratobasidium sp. 394]
MRDPAYPLFCALGIILCLLPLPWHWKARNTGTLLYIGWTILGCTMFLINSLVWAGNVDNAMPIWCDISAKLILGLGVGIPASSLCIQRRLYRIAKGRCKDTSDSFEDHQGLLIDMLLGVGLPILVMALSLVVQFRRYEIIEDIGCWPSTHNNQFLIPMILMWPIVIGMASFVYACRTIDILLKSRRQFSAILSGSTAGLNMSRYFRLMALAATEMACCIPLSVYFLFADLQIDTFEPWVSWEYTYRELKLVNSTPFELLQEWPDVRAVIDLNRWLVPGCAFTFFVFFGLSSEATEEYKRVFWGVAGLLGVKPPSARSQTSTGIVTGSDGGSKSPAAVQQPAEPGVRDIESQT